MTCRSYFEGSTKPHVRRVKRNFFFNFVLLFFIRIVVQQARNRAQNICYKNKAYVYLLCF